MNSHSLSVQAHAVRDPAGAGRPRGDAPMDQPVPGRGGGAAASAVEPRGGWGSGRGSDNGWGAAHDADKAGAGESVPAACQREPQGKP